MAVASCVDCSELGPSELAEERLVPAELEVARAERPSGVVEMLPGRSMNPMKRSARHAPVDDFDWESPRESMRAPLSEPPRSLERPTRAALRGLAGTAGDLAALRTNLRVGALMEPAEAVRPDTPLVALRERLAHGDVLVADKFGVPLGAVSAERAEAAAGRRCAGEVMEAVITVGIADRIVKALALMGTARVTRACVVSADETLVGILDRDRVLAWLDEALRVELDAAG